MMEIKILYSQGLSIRKIAKKLGISRNTVKKYIQKSVAQPRYSPRPEVSKKLSPYCDYLKARVKATQPEWIPATVLFKELKEQGYQGKESILRAYMRTLKPQAEPEEVVRFETLPGIQMQVDWAEFRRGPDRLSALIAILGFSRMAYVEFVTDEKIDTLLNGLKNAFEFFNGVPRNILFDNMKTVVIQRHAYGEGYHRFHAKLWDFAKHYGFMPKLCQPYRAQTKGKVERFIGYLRRSFYVPLKAVLAQANIIIDVDTANQKVKTWLNETANQRQHATTEKRPIDEWLLEQSCLIPLAAAYLLPRKAQSIPLITPSTLVPNREHSSEPLQHDLSVYQQLLH